MEAHLENEILQRLTRVETKLDLQLNAKDMAQEALNLSKSNKDNLDKLQDALKWLWRTVVGAFIVGIVTLIITWKEGIFK